MSDAPFEIVGLLVFILIWNTILVYSKVSGTARINWTIFLNSFIALMFLGIAWAVRQKQNLVIYSLVFCVLFAGQAYNLSRYTTADNGISTYSDSGKSVQVGLLLAVLVTTALLVKYAYSKGSKRGSRRRLK